MNFYPLYFQPIYKEKIWGGNILKEVFNKNIPNNKIGESWELAAHQHGTSIIINGPLNGQSLTSLIKKYPQKILGKKIKQSKEERFPLLIKFLDANDKLSVQVHPNDKVAEVEGELSKTEMWYIIKAKPGAKLIYGIKSGTNKEKFINSIKENKIEKYLNEVSVEEGDVFYIPSGTIHALEEGTFLVEIQQNSDSTYRIYDWNRLGNDGKPRPLHIDKALNVINFKQINKTKSKPLKIKNDNYIRYFLAASPYFITEKIKINQHWSITPGGDRFYVIIPLKGKGRLLYQDKNYQITPGKTIFLPASLDEVIIPDKVEFIISYLPFSKENIIENLTNLGFTQKDITQLPGISCFK